LCDERVGFQARRFFLMVVAKLDCPEARRGLIQLLSHWDANVRGESAAWLGRRRERQAIPALLGLLEDDEVYLMIGRTDPATETAIPVSEKAAEALEAITGTVRAQGAAPAKKVQAWLLWRDDRLGP
jgi:hypothetical protein